MSINPFELKAKKTEDTFMSWNELASRPYKKNTVDPYTKTRIILMNGTEYEAVWFGHNFSRKCDNNDIRRALAVTRREHDGIDLGGNTVWISPGKGGYPFVARPRIGIDYAEEYKDKPWRFYIKDNRFVSKK